MFARTIMCRCPLVSHAIGRFCSKMESVMESAVWGVPPGLVFRAVDAAILLKPSLDSLEETAVNRLLWKAVQKLSLVQRLLPDPLAVCSLNYQSLALRLTAPRRLGLPEDRPSDHTMLLSHVQKCRHFLQTVLEETIYELSYHGRFSYLEYVLCCDNLFNYDNLMMKEQSIDLNRAVALLKEKLTVVRENYEKTLLYFSEMTGPCLEQAVTSNWVQANAVETLTSSNEEARVQQNQYRRREMENSVSLALENTNGDIQEENIVHLEIENQILIETGNLQKEFDRWTKRYNDEIETFDIALLQLKSKLDEQREKYQKLLQTYNDKKEQLILLQEEANVRDAELELKTKRIKAAAVIQVWWRRCLFLRLLEKKIVARKAHSAKSGKSKKQLNRKRKK